MKKQKLVKPKRLAGFRDFFAEEVQIREYVINTFKKVFEKYGYEPLETPALEPTEIFTGEAGEEAEKLFYNFKDKGGREVMLKYEVMISMCRAVAENINQIIFPYKRYQIQNVWRAEKPQKGRFREFTQCDADTIGSDSMICDAEFIQMGIEALKALGFKKFKTNISNRKFLNGIIKLAGADNKDFIPICLSIDKLLKIGQAGVKKELLKKRKINPLVIDKILKIITSAGKTKDLIKKFKNDLKNIPVGLEGLNELEQIFDYLQKAGVEEKYYQFAPFIARGLAYYTGPIWEFEISEGGVGSVAGCGRYDETIGRFVNRRVPATGGSFGIERIVEIIKDKKMIKLSPTPTQVLVAFFDQETFKSSLTIASQLREAGIAALFYPEKVKLDKQLKYADRKGIKYVIIIGPAEAKTEKLVLKNLDTGHQETLSPNQAIQKVKLSRPK
jgi:histidyl-tRNA synthetase